MRSLVFLLLTWLCLQQLTSVAEGKSDKQNLIRELLDEPSLSIADPGPITLNLSISVIDLDYDSSNDVLTVTAWERYTWKDNRLTWDPRDFNNVSIVRLPDHLIWKPDIHLYNAYQGTYERTPVNAVVYSNGEVLWVPPSVLKVRCNRDVPDSNDSDTVTCLIRLGSWSYDGHYINLIPFDNEVRAGSVMSQYIGSPRLGVVSAVDRIESTTYECCAEPYHTYEVNLKLKIGQ